MPSHCSYTEKDQSYEGLIINIPYNNIICHNHMITRWCKQDRATHCHLLERGEGQNSLTFSFTDTFSLGGRVVR